MLKQRLVFGPAMILLLVSVFYLDDTLDQLNLTGTIWQRLFLGRTYLPAGLLMLFAILVIIAMMSRELCHIFRAKQIAASFTMVLLAGISGCTMIYILPYQLDSQTTMALMATLLIVIFLLSLLVYSWGRRTQGATAAAAVSMFAVVYLGLLPGFFVAIRRWHSAWVVAAIVLTVKSCDIGAYFTGRAIGRHKLIEWLSPKKTWEGLFGGIAFATAVGALLAWACNELGVGGIWFSVNGQRTFEPHHYPLWAGAGAGAIMGLVGQLGDLTASLFKRDAGIKDAGRSVPGFGGWIDVMDSPIVVAPLAYWLLAISRTLR